ncbi:apoptosis-associated speck-like protein containing a CARD [Xyrauchen texanus]|uniref:apoptosis-associated speck-like protein containing a CARD n=1 Tax=Xyrauchen texanus TaxID=154827 RepID=UPI0022429F76|nr:apoptosis-associated speck-like protein containing a CARD [Xyrauchen texanus]
MSEDNQDEREERQQCKEAQFVDKNSAHLIQRVTAVMPIADHLKDKNMLHEEQYSKIKAEKISQDQMRLLFESLKSGGDKVKTCFYYLLEDNEQHLFEELGGEIRKRKPSVPESPIPAKRKKPNNESNCPDNYNIASISAPRFPPACNTSINVTSITHVSDYKPAAPEKENKLTAPKKVKETPATKKVKNPPATKKEKKPAAVKQPALPKKVKQPALPKKVKQPALPKKVKQPALPKKVKQPALPKKVKQPALPKKVKQPALPKKVKQPALPTKVKQPALPKKVKQPALPKK